MTVTLGHYKTIRRDKGEAHAAFLIRIWRTFAPDLPADLRKADVPARIRIVVRQGYESPYQFGRRLRAMAHDDNAEVYMLNHRLDKDICHPVYYVYEGTEQVHAYDPYGEDDPA